MAFGFALLAVRFVLFPYVESYRDTLASMLAKELGHPVEIATLATGWDGWNPKLVVEGLRVLDPARTGILPLLELPRVELIVAWTSLPLLDLRLKQLVIEQPRLAIRRDRAGVLRMAGIEIDPSDATDESPIADWILRQREIVIRDALVTWNDDQRNAPQLVLDRVRFRLENGFGRHRFGLNGTPPAELAAPLEVRGEFRGASARDWQRAEGRLFVRLDYADVAAWREWLPLPGEIASGKGALRIWFEFAQGEPRGVTADLELADVRARFAEHLPEIELAHLSGRIGWRSATGQREVFARDLAFATVGDERLEPTNFTLTLSDGSGARPASGRLEFDSLQLAPVVALGNHLPLAEWVRADLARFSPRGSLARGSLRWEGTAESPTTFAAAAEFTDLGMPARDALPGATGLNGSCELTQDHGECRVASGNAVLEMPRVFTAPIALDSVRSAVKWDRRDGQTTVRIEQLEFANADAAASASGTYRTAAQGPGEIDIVAHASRVDVRQVHRYLPRTANDATRGWLRAALTRGAAVDARLKLAGNLARFPFADGKGGAFILTAKAKAVSLAYAQAWPPLDAIDADVRIDGTRMIVDATRGQAYGVDLGKTRAEIADLGAGVPLLRIEGEAAGPAAGFLKFVNESPVAARIGNVTVGGEAAGNGRLALRLTFPLGRLPDTGVAGEFTFSDAQLQLADAPTLARINGKVTFTERDLRARDIATEVLGGAARLAIASVDGRARVTGTGNVNLATLRRQYTYPYLDRLSGNVDWSITINLRPGTSTWVLESPLKGAVVDLPLPLGKSAADTMPLRIERRDDAAQAGADLITASYGRVAQIVAHRTPGESGATIDRALLSAGRAIERPDAGRADRPGLWIRAELPALDVDEWLALMRRGVSADAPRRADVPALAGADLDVGQLDAFGARFNDLAARIRDARGGWTLDLNGREIAGTATWSLPASGMPNGRIVARLARLALPGRGALAPSRDADARDAGREARAEPAVGNTWPEIDMVAESLSSKDRVLGRLEFAGQPRGAEWRIERLALANDSGRLGANGTLRGSGRQQQTQLDVDLEVKDAGGFLARFGYPDALQGAATRIDGKLAWNGAPHELDFPTLVGAFGLRVGPGRFTKIEPGPGKLLGVLSLQALPRRITLDFRDIFSEGFTFDEISGNVRITNGVMTTGDLKLVGPAAKVDIAGDADLARETQRLSVRVQPALSSSVSAGAALLFIANPLVGAAVGAGSLLAQTMMKDPIEKIFTYEYTVTGAWSDPVVTRSAAAAASVKPGTAPPSAVGAAQ